MQAVLLAAGMGKRLGRYTNNGTKCMVRVNGISLIERTITALVACKIKRFIIVVGYKSDVLKQFIAQKFPKKSLGGMEIEYIENTVYDKTNNIYSLYLARKELEKDETILLESDIIFKTDTLKSLVESKDKNVALVSQFEPWMDGTCAVLDDDHCITGIIDKQHFNWNDTKNYHKTVNIYKLSREFSQQFYIPFLEAYQKAFGKNEYYETVLRVLTFLNARTLKAQSVAGSEWHEIDDPEDLAVAENKFADTEQKLSQMAARYGGYWRFPEIKDFCYLVNPFFPTKRMDDELTANFSTLLRAYPSGAAEQSLLAGKLFSVLPEHIVVGNGAAELIHSFGDMITGKTAIPYPTFNEYPARFCHSETVAIPVHDDFSYTSADIVKTVTESGAKHVLLINPDNPSGHFLKKEAVIALLDALKEKDVTLIWDESFIDFAEPALRYTLIDEVTLSAYPNLVVIKSISKSYGVPGLRLGVLASSRTDLVQKVRKSNAIWNINSFGEYFLQIFGKYEKDYKKACDFLAAERTRFMQKLAEEIPNLTVFPSQANFVMGKLTGACSFSSLAQRALQDHALLIKDLSQKKGFDGKPFLRLAVMSPKENDFCVSVLKSILASSESD